MFAKSASGSISGSIEPSHALTAMGLPGDRIKSALRLTLGRGTTHEQLERVVEILTGIVGRLRQ